MGEHRVTIKIEFYMHGHENKHEMWVNWGDSLPESIADWVRHNYELAMDKYWEAEYGREQMAKAENENRERELLAQLKAKYE